MKKKKEIENNLWKLHRALIEYFLDTLKNHDQTAKSSTMNVIRAFLKDNAVTRNELKNTNPLEFADDILEDWSNEIDPENDHADDNDDDNSLKFAQ